jgi:hypothetical protein
VGERHLRTHNTKRITNYHKTQERDETTTTTIIQNKLTGFREKTHKQAGKNQNRNTFSVAQRSHHSQSEKASLSHIVVHCGNIPIVSKKPKRGEIERERKKRKRNKRATKTHFRGRSRDERSSKDVK